MKGDDVGFENFVSAYGKKMHVVKCAQTREGAPGAMQSFKDECDINNIMKKFKRTGAINWLNKHEGQYADLSEYDFRTSMDTIVRANLMFADLPSSVRDRFNNDPGKFLTFMHDPANSEEMIKLGLATKKPVPEPAKPVEVVVVEKK